MIREKRFSVSRMMTLWWWEGIWFPISRCWIVTIEPLPARDVPSNARPFCSSFDITFYDHTGNRELANVHRHGEFSLVSPDLIFVDGVWYELMVGRVVHRCDFGWCIEREAARNTKAAYMANAGFYAWRDESPWLRPIRWLIGRIVWCIKTTVRGWRGSFHAWRQRRARRAVRS